MEVLTDSRVSPRFYVYGSPAPVYTRVPSPPAPCRPWTRAFSQEGSWRPRFGEVGELPFGSNGPASPTCTSESHSKCRICWIPESPGFSLVLAKILVSSQLPVCPPSGYAEFILENERTYDILKPQQGISGL